MDHSSHCGKNVCVFCQKIPISSAISVTLKGPSQAPRPDGEDPVSLGRPHQGTVPRAVTQLRRSTCCLHAAASQVITVMRTGGPKDSTEPGWRWHLTESLCLREGASPEAEELLTYGLSYVGRKAKATRPHGGHQDEQPYRK